jgi:hemerythrin
MQIEWRNDLLTGVDEIDLQHRELFARFNDLLTACNQGKGRAEIDRLLGFLRTYVATHFAAEEELQVASGFPDYAVHKAAHGTFTADLDRLLGQLHSEGPSLPLVIQTNQMLVAWLIRHICRMDKALAEFLRSRAA